MNWYLEALKKYAVFDGRARRKEYWYFVLFNILISVVLMILDLVIGIYNPKENMGLFGGIYTLAVLLPGIAVTARRLHDTNRSGWWSLIVLLPIIGAIILLIFMVQDSQEGENQYGPNPKVAADSSRIAATEHYSIVPQTAPSVEHEGGIRIDPPDGQQQTIVDEDSIYTLIAKELETDIADKGMWTRLFAECGGDEKQTKVLYIKYRADRLISSERLRLEQAARERIAKAARLDQIRIKLNKKHSNGKIMPEKAGRFKWWCQKCATANWNHVEICKFCGSGKDGVVRDTQRYESVTKSEQKRGTKSQPLT